MHIKLNSLRTTAQVIWNEYKFGSFSFLLFYPLRNFQFGDGNIYSQWVDLGDSGVYSNIPGATGYLLPHLPSDEAE